MKNTVSGGGASNGSDQNGSGVKKQPRYKYIGQ